MAESPTILVTGGAGYIGSHTILELIRKGGVNVISADNFSNSSTRTFERIKRICGVAVKNYNVDLTNSETSRIIFEENQIDAVIHFAAFKSVGESVEQPEKYWRNNIESLKTILSLQHEFGVSTHIFSSSCSVYGNIEVLPVTEEAKLPKAESPYGETKQASEVVLSEFCEQHPEIKGISLRYFNPVGADHTGLLGEDPVFGTQNLVPILNQVAIGKRPALTVHGNDYDTPDGTCLRDYLHVTDLAKAHILAIDYAGSLTEKNYDVFNLGEGTGTSVKELLEAFEQVNELEVPHSYGPRRPGDASAIYADCTKAKEVLGWTPGLDLNEMMRSSWKWEKNMAQGI